MQLILFAIFRQIMDCLFCTAALSVMMMLVFSGCVEKEPAVEGNIPGANVKVERTKPTGAVEVEVEKK